MILIIIISVSEICLTKLIRMPMGLEDVSKYPDLFDRLYENREGEPTWTREDLEKLAGRNFIRVFQAVEAVNTKITNNI